MEGKVATSVINLQEKYYKQIGTTILSLRFTGILSKTSIKMNQAICQERNSFVNPLLPIGMEVNEYTMLKTNMMTELKLGAKDMIKGNRPLMKDNE